MSSTVILLCAMENTCKRGKSYSLSGEPLILDQRRWPRAMVAFAFTWRLWAEVRAGLPLPPQPSAPVTEAWASCLWLWRVYCPRGSREAWIKNFQVLHKHRRKGICPNQLLPASCEVPTLQGAGLCWWGTAKEAWGAMGAGGQGWSRTLTPGFDLKVSPHSSGAAEWEGVRVEPQGLPLHQRWWWCKMASPRVSSVVGWWVLMSAVGDMPQGGFFEPNPSHIACGGPVHGTRESKHCSAAGWQGCGEGGEGINVYEGE